MGFRENILAVFAAILIVFSVQYMMDPAERSQPPRVMISVITVVMAAYILYVWNETSASMLYPKV
jgi:protein-S-isoprenylcysteine O-methyltransferase Ste14